MTKLVVGCGYLGRRVARRWARSGETVCGVIRSTARVDALAGDGVRPLVADVLDPSTLGGLPPAATVVYAVAPPRDRRSAFEELLVTGLTNLLTALHTPADRLIVISSTGVYGQQNGQWVDEESICNPSRAAGRACLAAEQVPTKLGWGARTIILRLAGIYGPRRIPHQELIVAGRPIPRPSRGHLNLIHVDDAAVAVLAAASRGQPPRTYLVADGCPVLRTDYYAQVARWLGASPPTFTTPDPNSPAARRATADRKISNRRLRDELQVELRYRSYREGLQAILAGE